MENYNVLVLMKKDSSTGFLTDTVDSYTIAAGIEYIEGMYFQEKDDSDFVFMTLTTKDIEDWEYYGIYDLYNEDIYDELAAELIDGSGDYNPKWILKLKYLREREEMEQRLNRIIELHISELERIKPLLMEHRAKYMEMMEAAEAED
ncbi:MAG: DUF6762 family protein [Bacillota bacterium]